MTEDGTNAAAEDGATVNGGGPAPSSSLGVGPYGPRTLEAGEVAEKLGYSSRVVRYWAEQSKFDPPCPANVAKLPGGRKRLTFNLEEVKAWRREMGMTEDRNVLFTAAAEAANADAGKAEARAAARAGDDVGEDGELDPAKAIQRGLRMVNASLNRLEFEVMTPAQRAQESQSLKLLATEIRQWQAEQVEIEDRSNTLITRKRAMAIITAAMITVRNQVTALQTTVPAAIVQGAKDAKVAGAEQLGDVFERVAAATVAKCVDAVLTACAEGVARQAAAIESVGGSEPGVGAEVGIDRRAA